MVAWQPWWADCGPVSGPGPLLSPRTFQRGRAEPQATSFVGLNLSSAQSPGLRRAAPCSEHRAGLSSRHPALALLGGGAPWTLPPVSLLPLDPSPELSPVREGVWSSRVLLFSSCASDFLLPAPPPGLPPARFLSPCFPDLSNVVPARETCWASELIVAFLWGCVRALWACGFE